MADTLIALLPALLQGEHRALARCITAVENAAAGSRELLARLPAGGHTQVIGITGPPGAGKSSLADALLDTLLARQASVAVIAVDPSSPFRGGALLGDRIRMSRHFSHPGVFIRSLATRGALGGLHPRIIEICDLVRAAGFDYLLLETVGVGQNEVEIAALADSTLVVLTPESGDDIQTMKAGLMEVADIFVVNKGDLPGADTLMKNLRAMMREDTGGGWVAPVVKTVATTGEGMEALLACIAEHGQHRAGHPRDRAMLMAEKAWQLIAARRMEGLSRQDLQKEISAQMAAGNFNLYRFVLAQGGREGPEPA